MSFGVLAAALLALGLLAADAASAEPSVERVQRALESVRFVAYTPRGFAPWPTAPEVTAAAIRSDLELLRPYFDGLITYSCAKGLAAIPALARAQGYRAVVLGVWDPSDARELGLAIETARAQPETVIALALGNEGLFFRRYGASELASAFARARRELPGLALTTSEPFSSHLDAERSRAIPRQDFLLPVVHPIDQPWFGSAPPATAVEFVANVVRELEAASGLPVLVKETGLPSGPAELGFSESRQAEFWSALDAAVPATRARAVARFEAFDAPWKFDEVRAQTGHVRPTEAHWGLFRADGSPKTVAATRPAADRP